jgi:hypothetical protein
MEPMLGPKPVHRIMVHMPALPPERAVLHPPTPAAVLGSDLPEATPKLCLLSVDNLMEYREVLRCRTTTIQVNRSDTRNMARRASKALLRRSMIRSFPLLTP